MLCIDIMCTLRVFFVCLVFFLCSLVLVMVVIEVANSCAVVCGARCT